MNHLDALTRVVFSYIKERDGQTILLKDISADTAVNPKTARSKIKLLTEKGYIRCEGKKFFVLPKEN